MNTQNIEYFIDHRGIGILEQVCVISLLFSWQYHLIVIVGTVQ